MLQYFDQRKRSLLYALVVSDFKIRYQNSVLGYLWSLIRPLSLFAIMYVVFAKIFRVGNDIPHYAVYLLLGIMLWNFFAEATSNGLSSLLDRGDMIRKVYTPRYSIVLAAVFSATVNLAINLCVVAFFAVIAGADFNPLRLLLLPFLLFELVLLATAASFLLASLYVKYRDIKYIWELFLQIAFYATPIVYTLNRVPAQFRRFMMLNPVAQIIQDARYAAITPKSPTAIQISGQWAVVPFVVILVLAAISIWYFRTQNRFLAEEL